MSPSSAVSLVRIGRRLLVTMPPNPGDDEISDVQDRILQAMDRDRTSGVVLDIGTVGVVDSYFARMLVETSEMVRLMGGRTVVTGLQPAVAMTLTELGLDLSSVRTAVDVEAGLELLAPEGGG